MGANLFFAGTGATLEFNGDGDEALLGAWRVRVQRARAHLGWEETGIVARRHAGGVLLSIAAPIDQLFLATEVNEWALCAALQEREPALGADLEAGLLAAALENTPGGAAAADPAAIDAPVLEEAAAFARFARLAAREARPALRALLGEAEARDLPYLLDEKLLTLGAGSGGRSFALEELPASNAVPWAELHDVPTAIVTGSNGKTTTVRLLRPVRASRAGAQATTARTACSSARSCWRAVIIPGPPARAACCGTCVPGPPSWKWRAGGSCAVAWRSRARGWPSSPTSAPIISASTGSMISTASPTPN